METLEKLKIVRFEYNISDRFVVHKCKTGVEYELVNYKKSKFKSEQDMNDFIALKLEERKRILKLEGTLSRAELLKLFPDYEFCKLPLKVITECIAEVMLEHGYYEFERYDFCYLDVKVRDLKTGDSGDHLNNIHYDWVNDKNHPNKEETHFIYTSTGGTKFIDYGVITKEHSIYQYNRDLHQSPILTEDVRRVMIRLSFVDSLKH